jgi:hypothetical protein
VKVYYDNNIVYPQARLHPYAPGAPDQSGYVDFKLEPERISTVLEDFRPYAERPSIQAFYRLLRDINGAASHLETSDCGFRSPRPNQDPNSPFALRAFGRVYVLFRDLRLNCSRQRVDWLCSRLMAVLTETDPQMPAAQGVVGFTHNSVLHTAMSSGEWRADGSFESGGPDDPGFGMHLLLSFWAYGDTEDEVYQNLGRLFENMGVACRSVSAEIDASTA